jgi:predicted Zn-dependent protease
VTLLARYYDGRSATAHRVELAIGPSSTLQITGDGIDLVFRASSVDLQPPLAKLPRVLLLPNGAQCETDDTESFDQLIAPHLRPRHRVEAGIHRIERKPLYAIVAVLLLIAVLYVTIVYGLPFMATTIAMRVSPSLESSLGAQTLAGLDRLAFEPSALDEARREALRDRFATILKAARDDLTAQLEFRASPPMGPNAFTLPGGVVVVLDELVSFAQSNEEVAAVMCHELGHVRQRHTLRAALQNSGVVLLIGAVFGDAALSTTSFATALPLAVLHSRNSRDFEREADLYAVSLMDASGIASDHYAAMLERLERRTRGGAGRFPDFLASHPQSAERLEALRSRSQSAK